MSTLISNPFGLFFAADDMIRDIVEFHEHFGLGQPFAKNPITDEEWRLRGKRLVEEVEEFLDAQAKGNDAECLDALVDLVYIALGTAYRRGWDFEEAWDRVHDANMLKERAQEKTQSRHKSKFDIVKPKGWEAPNLEDLV